MTDRTLYEKYILMLDIDICFIRIFCPLPTIPTGVSIGVNSTLFHHFLGFLKIFLPLKSLKMGIKKVDALKHRPM